MHPLRVLLVEDDDVDAMMAEQNLKAGDRRCEVTVATTYADALAELRARPVDLILLDMGLPDSSGPQTVTGLRGAADDVPIVVLTAQEDDEVAMDCFRAGAQDYIRKSEVTPQSLARAVMYADVRLNGHRIRQLEAVLSKYRLLSFANNGGGADRDRDFRPLRERAPATYAAIESGYDKLLVRYATQPPGSSETLGALTHVAETVGNQGGGASDMVELHTAVLERALAQGRLPEALNAADARVLLTEVLGMLADYYRLGGTPG